MIHVTWHMTTIAFLTVGFALLLSGAVVDGDMAPGDRPGRRRRVHRLRGARAGAGGRPGDPRDRCSATPAPSRSPPPRRWRGGAFCDAQSSGGRRPQAAIVIGETELNAGSSQSAIIWSMSAAVTSPVASIGSRS